MALLGKISTGFSAAIFASSRLRCFCATRFEVVALVGLVRSVGPDRSAGSVGSAGLAGLGQSVGQVGGLGSLGGLGGLSGLEGNGRIWCPTHLGLHRDALTECCQGLDSDYMTLP